MNRKGQADDGKETARNLQHCAAVVTIPHVGATRFDQQRPAVDLTLWLFRMAALGLASPATRWRSFVTNAWFMRFMRSNTVSSRSRANQR